MGIYLVYTQISATDQENRSCWRGGGSPSPEEDGRAFDVLDVAVPADFSRRSEMSASTSPSLNFSVTCPAACAAAALDTRRSTSITRAKPRDRGRSGSSDAASRARRRSEERRGGKKGVSTCRSRWSPYH